jgi:hypothetical protein
MIDQFMISFIVPRSPSKTKFKSKWIAAFDIYNIYHHLQIRHNVVNDVCNGQSELQSRRATIPTRAIILISEFCTVCKIWLTYRFFLTLLL